LVRQWRRGDPGSRVLNPLAHPYSLSRAPFAAVAFIVLIAGCSSPPPPAPVPTPRPVFAELQPAPGVPGDPNNGRTLFTGKGCNTCHTVLPLPNASGAVGPNLTNMVLRPTIAGEQIPNTPVNMARWIMDPQAMKPGTQMQALGVTNQEAIDLTAFLYSLPYNPQ
jgi:cytochrome c